VESVFAVVVHKAGIAARFAHNHFICAKEYTAKLDVEGSDAATAKFEIALPVAKLVADAPDAHAKWYPAVEKAGILDEPFVALEEDDRKSVATHMLAKDQLDAGQFPVITAKTVAVRAEASTQGKQHFTHKVTVALTVHGKTVERECAAAISIVADRVTVDAVGAFTFSEFGIKPYSAMLGAVKNKDPFHVVVHIAAKLKQ
jgi:hypothetical protein